MESSGKDSRSASSDSDTDVIIYRRLRDRTVLRRKAEVLEKDSSQCVLRGDEKQQQTRGRRAKRGRVCQEVERAILTPETSTEPQPDLQEEAKPVHSEPALPEPVYQEQPAMPTNQNLDSGMQPVAVEGEPAVRTMDLVGEEKVVKPAKAEILEDVNTPVENEQQDN